MEITPHDYEAASCRSQQAQEAQEFNLFVMLKPVLRKDGNKWCVLYGDNLQEGISGWGDSPHSAIMDFNSQWYEQIQS